MTPRQSRVLTAIGDLPENEVASVETIMADTGLHRAFIDRALISLLGAGFVFIRKADEYRSGSGVLWITLTEDGERAYAALKAEQGISAIHPTGNGSTAQAGFSEYRLE